MRPWAGARRGWLEIADSNNDARIKLTDGVYLLTWLFLGVAAPMVPSPGCGPDPDGPGGRGTLGCESYADVIKQGAQHPACLSPGTVLRRQGLQAWSTLFQIPSSRLFTVLQKYKHEMCIILALDLCVVRDNCQRR